MSTTLYIRKTPRPSPVDLYCFGLPIKRSISRRFYDHDGSLGGQIITVDSEHLDWFEGLLAGFSGTERERLREVVNILRAGGTIDMWIEC